ncbi:hypothetical protein BH23PLA1_BH23PLA1_03730 [soil metagenome]
MRTVPSQGSQRDLRDLATESIVVKIRWFGIAMGYALILTRDGLRDPWAVSAILALGAGYAALDTAFYHWGEVFLKRWPLFVSLMESVFIALLCYHDTGLESPFRWYYLLSLLCCSMRYPRWIAWMTFGLHCLSFLCLVLALRPGDLFATDLPMTVVILAWMTWASSSLSNLLRRAGEQLERANAALQQHRDELEVRVAERTTALRASQARELQKEKMSAFCLLSAGIAHEVGNPLAALSSLVQMLQRRGPDPYTAEKLKLAGSQLERIRRTIRELVDFSRPACNNVGPVRLAEVVSEGLGISKYYQRTKGRQISTAIPDDLPAVWTVRDHVTQVLFNLLLNAIDATDKGGHIRISAQRVGSAVELEVADDGPGISPEGQARLFQPYYTTKAVGTGLGLFVSRQIVEELSGTLTYQTIPGEGSTFTIRLPLTEPRRAALSDSPATLIRQRPPAYVGGGGS